LGGPWRIVRGKTVFVSVVVLAGVASVLARGRDSEAVQVVALRELLEAAPEPDGVSRSVCLSMWTGKTSHSTGRRIDPPSDLLAAFASEGRPVYQASQCHEDRAGVWDPGHREAVLLSISRLEWVSSDFVKTEGYWLLDGFSAQGFRLTLWKGRHGWRIDMAVPTWIS
jgi:hypothetical protein